jgi:hypothetical protein
MAALRSRVHGAIHPVGHGTRVLATGLLPVFRKYPDDVPPSAFEAASPIMLYMRPCLGPAPSSSTAHLQDLLLDILTTHVPETLPSNQYILESSCRHPA